MMKLIYLGKHQYPSNINHKSLLLYCGMDLLRGTNLNMGFGTDMPYSIIGAPWLEPLSY